jgi:U3 small nucleolar RNA-associated protein 14
MQIQQALEASGMDSEQNLTKAETLAMRQLSMEEVKQRQSELRRTKCLLFYHEQKLKRIKKIKSRTYRKILKKKRNSEKMSLESLEELDPEMAGS